MKSPEVKNAGLGYKREGRDDFCENWLPTGGEQPGLKPAVGEGGKPANHNLYAQSLRTQRAT